MKINANGLMTGLFFTGHGGFPGRLLWACLLPGYQKAGQSENSLQGSSSTTIVTLIFFSVFGGSALQLERFGIAKLSELATETVTFGMYGYYPLGTVMSFVTVFVIAIFFITSADSATFVLGMFSTTGSLNPANIVKIIWGLTLSAIAAIVMYSGGIEGFQNMLIIAALPFSVIVILMAVSFYKTAKTDK